MTIRLPKPVPRVGGPALRIGCCAYSYREYLTGNPPRMTMEGFLDRCAELGCDGVEITAYYVPRPITPGYLRRVARRCFLLGLEVAGTAVGNTFTLPAGSAREAQLNLVRHWIDLSADLGAPCLRVFAGPVPRDADERTGRKWVAECLDECLAYAAERGVMLALENHGGVVARPAGVFDILRRARSDWLGLKLDTGNFVSADPYADLALCAPYAVSTHVKTEVSRNGVPEPADLQAIVRILRQSGYRGYLNLEYEGTEDAATAVPRAIEDMRQAVISVQRAM